jgi:hypothetical protein
LNDAKNILKSWQYLINSSKTQSFLFFFFLFSCPSPLFTIFNYHKLITHNSTQQPIGTIIKGRTCLPLPPSLTTPSSSLFLSRHEQIPKKKRAQKQNPKLTMTIQAASTILEDSNLKISPDEHSKIKCESDG